MGCERLKDARCLFKFLQLSSASKFVDILFFLSEDHGYLDKWNLNVILICYFKC